MPTGSTGGRRPPRAHEAPPPQRTSADKCNDPALYQRAWEHYKREPTERGLCRAIGVARATAKSLIEVGIPALQLPPLRAKLAAALRLAQQYDVDECARSLALGRGAVRTLLVKFAAAASQLQPHEIPKPLIVPQLAQLVVLNEKLSAVQKGDEKPDFTDENVADVLSGFLTAIAARRLPGGARLLDQEGGKGFIIEQPAGLLPEKASPAAAGDDEDGDEPPQVPEKRKRGRQRRHAGE